jgi:hypothetical protein
MLRNCTLELGWGHLQVMQMLCLGFQVDIFVKCKTCMLPKLINDISTALNDAKVWALQTPIIAIQSVAPTNSAAYTPFLMEDSERTWAMTTNVGLQTMGVPAGSVQHRSINANPFQASLVGLHLEEFLARSAACELPIPLTELDALLFILFRTVRDAFGAVQNETYFRVRCGLRGRAVRSFLVCLRTVVVFDGGEVREVWSPIPPPSTFFSFFFTSPPRARNPAAHDFTHSAVCPSTR